MDPAATAASVAPLPDEAAAPAAGPPAQLEPAKQEQADDGAAVKPDQQPVEAPAEEPAAGEEAPPPPPPPPPPAAAEPAAAEPAGEAEGVKAEAAPAALEEVAPAPPAEAPKEEAAEAGESEAGAPAAPSDEALVARLRQLLAEIDLATTTEKQLRRKLEAEYGCDLADRKALLRAEINAYLQAEEGEGEEEAAEEEGEEEEEEATSGRKRGRGGGSGSSLGSFLSPEMQEFLGEERLPRTQVVKRMWAYIKENGLQDPKDKRVIVFDGKLQKLFPGTRTNMFKLQKLLSKHCKTSDVVGGDEEEEDGEEAQSEGEEPAPKKRRASSGAARSSGGRRSSAAGGERKPGGFQKECQLSEEMAAWIGKPAASRPEITKFFWAYCKERELQDPSDKSFILADDTLKALTGEERFKGFGFAKLIKQHLS